jgi:hypothetical protein
VDNAAPAVAKKDRRERRIVFAPVLISETMLPRLRTCTSES